MENRISMNEKMNKSEKAIEIAWMMKKNGICSECFWKFIKNMKPKREEAI